MDPIPQEEKNPRKKKLKILKKSQKLYPPYPTRNPFNKLIFSP